MSYEIVIGLETHIELATRQKMFCQCSADHFGKKPNSQTCPVCLGLPGALPFPNQKAIQWTILLGLALDCRIPLSAKFDRKNYFYPDLSKGYQISQYDKPFALSGQLSVVSEGKSLPIRINRVHLEEDTGKLIHATVAGKNSSLIDFNRSGVPLVEIVTEPDINSIVNLGQFARKLRQLVKGLGISQANMEKGQMRFELNISLRPQGNQNLPPYRVEVKNINSFKFLEQAAEFEVQRQTKILSRGIQPRQETRGFNAKKQVTYSQRGKEQAHDYRYFPEPDIPPIVWQMIHIEKIKKQLPELPEQKINRLVNEYQINETEADFLVHKSKLVAYFEKSVQLGREKGLTGKNIANILINKRVKYDKLTPSALVEMLIESSQKKELDRDQILKVIDEVLRTNPEIVIRYQQGKSGLFEFFVGQVMKQTHSQVKAELIRKILTEKLSKNNQ